MVEQQHRRPLDLAAQPTTGKPVHAHVQIDERLDELELERAGRRKRSAGHRPREPTRRPPALSGEVDVTAQSRETMTLTASGDEHFGATDRAPPLRLKQK